MQSSPDGSCHQLEVEVSLDVHKTKVELMSLTDGERTAASKKVGEDGDASWAVLVGVAAGGLLVVGALVVHGVVTVVLALHALGEAVLLGRDGRDHGGSGGRESEESELHFDGGGWWVGCVGVEVDWKCWRRARDCWCAELLLLCWMKREQRWKTRPYLYTIVVAWPRTLRLLLISKDRRFDAHVEQQSTLSMQRPGHSTIRYPHA